MGARSSWPRRSACCRWSVAVISVWGASTRRAGKGRARGHTSAGPSTSSTGWGFTSGAPRPRRPPAACTPGHVVGGAGHAMHADQLAVLGAVVLVRRGPDEDDEQERADYHQAEPPADAPRVGRATGRRRSVRRPRRRPRSGTRGRPSQWRAPAHGALTRPRRHELEITLGCQPAERRRRVPIAPQIKSARTQGCSILAILPLLGFDDAALTLAMLKSSLTPQGCQCGPRDARGPAPWPR